MKKFKGFTLIELIVVMVIISVLCVICSLTIKNKSNKISSGTVVSKDYSPARRSSKSYIPESFTITIEGEKDGKIVEYTFNVPESEYIMYNVGDWYPKER